MEKLAYLLGSMYALEKLGGSASPQRLRRVWKALIKKQRNVLPGSDEATQLFAQTREARRKLDWKEALGKQPLARDAMRRWGQEALAKAPSPPAPVSTYKF